VDRAGALLVVDDVGQCHLAREAGRLEAVISPVLCRLANRTLRSSCDHQMRRLPIVNADKRLVGIVALGDFAVESSDIEAAGEALSEISKPS